MPVWKPGTAGKSAEAMKFADRMRSVGTALAIVVVNALMPVLVVFGTPLFFGMERLGARRRPDGSARCFAVTTLAIYALLGARTPPAAPPPGPG